MALKWLRENFKRLKFVLWIVIITLGASMLVFFVNPPNVGLNLSSAEVASVGEYRITREEYGQAYSRLLEQFKPYMDQNPEFAKQMRLEQQALSQLISSYAVLVEAERMGLKVTPREVLDRIMEYPLFQRNGEFVGTGEYQQILRSRNIDLRTFENNIQMAIAANKLRNLLTDPLDVTPQEVRQEFLKRNQEAKVRYVTFNIGEVQPEEVTDEELREYYQDNLQHYTAPEKRRAKTLSVKIEPTDVEVSEAEIQAAMPEGEPDTVGASHILFKIEGDVQKAREEAQKVLEEIQAGANFAAMAAKHSDDPETADKGGELGFVTKDDLEPGLAEAVFALEPGEVADYIVPTNRGLHIVKQNAQGASQDRSLAMFNARQKKADERARALADQIAAELKAGDSLEEAAARHGLQVKETDWFERSQRVPGTTAEVQFTGMVFELGDPGDVTSVFEAGAGHYVFAELLETRPPGARPFEDVRAEVERKYRDMMGRKLAETQAQAFARQARAEGADFEELAGEKDLRVTTTEFFKKGATIDDTLRFSPLIHDEVFTMEPGEVGSAVRVRDNFVAFQLLERSPVDEEKFEQEKDGIRENLLAQKRSDFFSNYVQKVVQRLEAQNKIERNQALLDQLFG